MYRMGYWVTAAALVVSACEGNSRFSCENGKACPTGQRCEKTTLLCVLDVPPLITLTQPQAMALVAGSKVTVEGAVRDDAEDGVTVAFSSDGEQWTPVPLGADRKFQVEVPLPDKDSEPFLITFKATDAAGKPDSVELPLTVDNVSPRCMVSNISETGLLLNDGGTEILLSVADGSPTLGEALVSVDDKPLPTEQSGRLITATWSNPPQQNGADHTVKYRVLDAAGNVCEGQRPVILDAVPPTLLVTAPGNDAILGKSWFSGTPWVTGPAPQDGLNPVPTLTVDWGDGLGPQSVSVIDGGYRFTVPDEAEDFVTHQVKVTATDWAGNSTTVERTVYVDTVAPKFTLLSPALDAGFKAADFVAGADVTVKFDFTDGDKQHVVSASLNGGSYSPVQGGSLNVTTSATDNPKGYQVKLRAADRAGNETQGTAFFSVDRVAPSVTSTVPPNNSRNFDYQQGTQVNFSEPMAPAASALTSALAGAWNSQRTQWKSGALTPDTVHDLQIATLTDSYGNPVATSSSYKFSTMPARPAAGVLLTNVDDFVAVADPDGAISVFTLGLSGAMLYKWHRVNSKTGAMETIWSDQPRNSPQYRTSNWQVSAWRNLLPDLTSQRVIGLSMFVDETIDHSRVVSRIGETPGGNLFANLFLPLPPMGDEAPGSGAGGYITGNQYTRDGRSPITLGVSPTHLAYTQNRFEALEVIIPNVNLQIYQCPPSGSCSLSAATTVITDASAAVTNSVDFTSAATPGCTAYAYNTATQRKSRFHFRGVCTTAPLCPTSYVETELIGNGSRYAPTFIGDGLLRARNDTGGIQLAIRDCFSNGAWTNIGSPVSSPYLYSFQPVAAGGKFGVIFINHSNELELYWAN